MIAGGGLTVDINSPEQMANGALNLIADDVLYLRCSNSAKERVKEFLPEVVIGQYEALYHRVLESKAGLPVRTR